MDSVDKTTASFESLGLTKPQQKLEKPRLGQEDFMNLMIAQANNQDPFKPMENGEFLSQMAQFSTVSGLKEIKDSFNTLAEALKSQQALQASTMVGRSVLVPGSDAPLPESGPLRGAVDLPSSVEKLTIDIVDAAGEVVHQIEMESKPAGMTDFSWDGAIKNTKQGEAVTNALPGKYTLKATALINGKNQALDTFIVDSVESVSLGKKGTDMTLNLANAGSVGLPDIRQIK